MVVKNTEGKDITLRGILLCGTADAPAKCLMQNFVLPVSLHCFVIFRIIVIFCVGFARLLHLLLRAFPAGLKRIFIISSPGNALAP